MQIAGMRRVCLTLDGSAVADGARVWGWWQAGINLGTELHVYQPPVCHKLSPNWLSISPPQGETPQHPPAGRCLWNPERVLPVPWAVSPQIRGFLFFWEFNDFCTWYLYQWIYCLNLLFSIQNILLNYIKSLILIQIINFKSKGMWLLSI